MPPSTSAPIPRSARAAGTIVARQITRAFGGRIALSPTDLELGPGGIVGLLGPNGSGKTTLLRALTGLVRPDAGRAWIDGVELEGDGTAIRRRVAFAPGEIALYTELRALEHLRWLARGRDARAFERSCAIADALGLPLRARVRTYSHGMKRQLLLAAALAPDVRVRILDEPTEGLDPTKRGQVLDLLRADARVGTTILLSSHHLGEVDRASDRLVFLAEGRKIADETRAAVDARSRRFVRLEFAAGASSADVTGAVERAGGARVRLETSPTGTLRVGLFLSSDDPRAFLAELSRDPRLPRPESLEWGRLSLAELYRELYGVEGC